MHKNAQDKMQNINAQDELAKIRRIRKMKQKRRFHKSKLDYYRTNLIELRKEGGSYPDLVEWLRTEKRVKVHHTTVMRFLNKWGIQ